MWHHQDMAQAEAVEWVPVDTFGARLALIRQRKQWNVKEAAEVCGIPTASWRAWEHGASPRGMNQIARKIATRVGCSYTWLAAGGPLGEPHVPDGERGSVWAPTLITCDGEHPFDDPTGDASPVPNTPPRAA